LQCRTYRPVRTWRQEARHVHCVLYSSATGDFSLTLRGRAWRHLCCLLPLFYARIDSQCLVPHAMIKVACLKLRWFFTLFSRGRGHTRGGGSAGSCCHDFWELSASPSGQWSISSPQQLKVLSHVIK
jgi:hypothetical protein